MTPGHEPRKPDCRASTLTLTDCFELKTDGRRLSVPHSVERLLAYLALANASVSRSMLAGVLWSDTTQQRAASNLSTALWRLGGTGVPLITARHDRLVLASDVTVDLRELFGAMHALIRGDAVDELTHAGVLSARTDVLPDWGDSWVLNERERFRLLRLEALEKVASTLLDQGRLVDALSTALAAIRTEPLRESSWRLVMRTHIRNGNAAEAIRAYRQYSTALERELGVEPSRMMHQLLQRIQNPPRDPPLTAEPDLASLVRRSQSLQ